MGKCIHSFKEHGKAPNLHVMDNECSSEIKDAFKAHNISFQLVHPQRYRRNTAERAIHTLNNHLITTICTCNPKLPANECDCILPQVITTLNLLQSFHRSPSLSVYAAFLEKINFNTTPLPPSGNTILLHEKFQPRILRIPWHRQLVYWPINKPLSMLQVVDS